MKILPTVLFFTGTRRCLHKTLTQQTTNIYRNELINKQINNHIVKCYHKSCFNLTRKNDELKQLAITIDDQNLLKSGELRKDLMKSLIKPDKLSRLKETDYDDDDDDAFSRRTRKPRGTHLKSGAIRNKPVVNKHGRFNALLLVLLFIFLGGQLSSIGARVLHDNEIFSLPEDEYDDF